MSLELITDVYHFNGKMVPAATASVVDGPWCKTDTSAGGAPTLAASGGHMVGTLAADDEVENLCLSFGDVLPYDIDDLVRVEMWLKLSAAIAAAVKFRFGLTGNRNDDPDAIAQSILFGVNGDAASNPLHAECDDGTNEVAATALSGFTLGTTLRKFEIDFGSGLLTQSPPALSVGGKANLILRAENARGDMCVVAKGTRFNMSAYAGGLQPFFQLQKSGGATTPAFSLRRVHVTHRVR